MSNFCICHNIKGEDIIILALNGLENLEKRQFGRGRPVKGCTSLHFNLIGTTIGIVTAQIWNIYLYLDAMVRFNIMLPTAECSNSRIYLKTEDDCLNKLAFCLCSNADWTYSSDYDMTIKMPVSSDGKGKISKQRYSLIW